MTLSAIPGPDQKVMPWANGGGSTVQVAIDPPHGSLADGFRWRVSRANVGSDGPFSVLPGVDRTLWLWRGNGMRLVRRGGGADAREVELTQPLQRVDFAGEEQVMATLLAGPCQDLNVMVRRGVVRADLQILQLALGTHTLPSSPECLLLVLAGTVVVGDVRLAADDALLATGAGPLAMVATGPATLLCARFWPMD